MNVNTVTRVKMKKAHRSKQNTKKGVGATSGVAILEKQSAVTRGLQTAQRWSQIRAARVEELRKQVEAGTYAVDSMALAERMLQINTHFLEENGD